MLSSLISAIVFPFDFYDRIENDVDNYNVLTQIQVNKPLRFICIQWLLCSCHFIFYQRQVSFLFCVASRDILVVNTSPGRLIVTFQPISLYFCV